MEARIVQDGWYGDTFLRTSDSNFLTLVDSNRIHSIGDWYQLTVTYDGAQFRQYVNTTLELAGALSVPPLTNGVCSIGMRANTNSFFEGAIRALRFTGRVLDTNEFLCVPRGVLRGPEFSRGWTRLGFQIDSGLPLAILIQRSARAEGPWNEVVGKPSSADPTGTSYLWMIPADASSEFYRVMFP